MRLNRLGACLLLFGALAGCGDTPPAACGPQNCPGCCDAEGQCQPGSESGSCGTNGERCAATACPTAPSPDGGECTPASCDGCCSGGQCVGAAEQSSTACGLSGAACAACDTNFACVSGTCEEPPVDAGACGPGSCSGCCQGELCITPGVTSACGIGGEACGACSAFELCVFGGCVVAADGGVDGGAADAGVDAGVYPRSDGGFVFLALHPQARLQSTAWGKELNILYAWNGQLYSGYGDWTANTGPIHIRPFDPSTGTFSAVAHISDTENIESFRAINGRLWAPAVDPRVRADYAVGEPFSDARPLNVTHVFDVATLDGTDVLVASQAGNARCRIQRSSGVPGADGGFTWTLLREEAPLKAGSYCRPYLAGTYNGRFYYQATDTPSGKHARSWVFDGGSWTVGPDLLPTYGYGYRLSEIAGRMVYQSGHYGISSDLFSSDGVFVSEPLFRQRFAAFSVSEGQLVALRVSQNGGREVVSSDDLKSWRYLVADPPRNAKSIELLDGGIYVGTTDAGLWRFEGAASWVNIPGDWNDYPLATRTSPAGDAGTYSGDAGVLISATAADRDGTIARVDLWIGATRVQVATPPYQTVWTPTAPGTYRISARAIDNRGAYADSEPFFLTVP